MRGSTDVDETLGVPDDVCDSNPRGIEGELQRGETVGRFIVLSRVGAGGMGVVYSAYDPELDRKVALKVLQREVAGDSSVGRARLLREAKALAKLSHAHVVAIHDVGTHEQKVWLAMEFVAGKTLTRWSIERRRSWREVLAVMRPVALGLAAAHEAGLVHRDVKPDNVMVDDDPSGENAIGRVRVMDFGLARGTRTSTQDEDDDQPRRLPVEEAVTRIGATPGTPPYMAPEQLSAGPTDARTDQFSYCVMLWEALYGERPFEGASVTELAANILEGNRRSPPRGVRVPRWLRAVMLRGLAVEASDRWPSLTALLHALDRGRGRARVFPIVLGVGVVGLAAAGVLFEQRRQIAACEASGGEIEEVWNDGEREAVRAGLIASGAGHAAATADKVMPWIDAHVSAWRTVRTQACMDAEVRERWDADVHARSVSCLDERKLQLGALLRELKAADVEALDKAVVAAAGLREVESCADETLLSRVEPPPTEAGDEIDAVRAELSRAYALHVTGAYEDGLPIARAGLERAEAIGWPPLTASARLRVGGLLEKTGAYADAEQMLEQAYFEGADAGAIEEAHSAANWLVYVVGVRLVRPTEGARWSRIADLTRSSLPDRGGLREAMTLNSLALVRNATGDYAESAKLHERALTIREQALGREHPLLVESLANLAVARRHMGAYEDAAALHERALAIAEEVFGAQHPSVAHSLDSLAGVRSAMGAYEDAARLQERAFAILEHAFGPDHVELAPSLNNLANARFDAGSYEEAAQLYTRALAIWEKAHGPEHPHVAASLGGLANVRDQLGAHDEAAKLHERALAILEKTLGPDHPDVAMSLYNLAVAREAMGAYEDAAQLDQRALAIWEKSLGADHPYVAHARDALTRVRDRDQKSMQP